MRSRLLAGIFGVFLAGLLVREMRNVAVAQAGQAAVVRVPVIVELFTSEGCSSCPPADSLLAELDKRQPLGSADIIAIEEHVDYWDQDGWKDPFSSHTWTARQYDYAASLHNGNPYTPEMIIDGTDGFVGSRGGTARQEIEKAAATKKLAVKISAVSPVQNNSVALNVSVDKLSNATPKETEEVILAVTEAGLHSSVKAGENNGKELQHSPVLRELKVIGAFSKNGQEGFTAQPTVKLDTKWNVDNLRAIIFVQEKKSRRVLGASEIPLKP